MKNAPTEQLTSSGKDNPCPICGRTKDDDCRISADLVQCCYGATHSPPAGLKPGEVITGADGQRWAYTGDASGLRERAVFTIDKPRNSTATGNGNGKGSAALPSFTLARLPQPAPLPPVHWPHGHRLIYADGLVVEVAVKADGKAFYPKHQTTANKWARGKGPDPWPLWRQADAITHGRGRWIAETEGEKCAEWLRAAGVVAISQPGHDLGRASLQRRYAALAAAGVAGVAYLADHDDEGQRKASKCAAAAAAAGLQLLAINAADVWPGLPTKGSIDDAPGAASARAAAFELAAANALQQQANKPPTPPGQCPYRVLGWDPDRTRIFYQHRSTGQIASIKPSATSGALLSLASMQHWEHHHRKQNGGVAWDAALGAVIEEANTAGVFVVERTRGRGVWLDADRIIWHLGDRLEVDGKPLALIEHRSANHYPRLPALEINTDAVPLSDQEGSAILDAVRQMGWRSPLDAYHLLGWAMLANVGGALDKRPVLQNTSERGSGKTFVRERLLEPLLAGLAISRSGSTEAGIRQTLKTGSLPVLIDESEGEDPNRRRGHLVLARLSYDGSPSDRGTTHGQALSYAVRSSIALSGINATITNPADRSRTVVVSRRFLPVEQWQPIAKRIETLCTPAVGARLVRRAVSNLHTLRANVVTFRRAVEAQISGTAAARAGDTYGALLAGVYLLTSTATVSDEDAIAWLDAIGWSGTLALGDDGEEDEGANEGKQCLTALLTHEEPWRLVDKERGSGRVSIGELLCMVQLGSPGDEVAEAYKLLGRRGIKWTDCGVLIANKPEPLAPIFRNTRWRDGGHRARLLDVPGAEVAGSVHFPALGTMRATRLPLSCLPNGG